MKKILITIFSGIAIMSTMVGCASTGYNAEQRDMDLGIEVMSQRMKSDEKNLIEVSGNILCDMENEKPEIKIEEAKTPKQSNDMIYGILKHSKDTLLRIESMTPVEFLKEFNYDEADMDDVEKFKARVTPIFKDMAIVMNNVINNPEFNGTIDKENLDKFMKLYDEYYVYYSGYYDKVLDYEFGN